MKKDSAYVIGFIASVTILFLNKLIMPAVLVVILVLIIQMYGKTTTS